MCTVRRAPRGNVAIRQHGRSQHQAGADERARAGVLDPVHDRSKQTRTPDRRDPATNKPHENHGAAFPEQQALDTTWRDSQRQFERIGCVSENQRLPDWMTPHQLFDYVRPFYPTWDERLFGRLRARLGLTARTPLRSLSRGTRMKAALLASLADHPELMVLDEPFTGLDPLVRDELVEALLELPDGHRRTVFISSHDSEEVERLADWIAFIDAGRIVFAEPVTSLLARFRLIEVVAPAGFALAPRPAPGWLVAGSRPALAANADARELASLLGDLVWFAQVLLMGVLVALVVQAHPVVGSDAFWMTRPIPPRTLPASKLVLVGVAVIAVPRDRARGADVDVRGAAGSDPGGIGRTRAVPDFWVALLVTAAALTRSLAGFALLCSAGHRRARGARHGADRDCDGEHGRDTVDGWWRRERGPAWTADESSLRLGACGESAQARYGLSARIERIGAGGSSSTAICSSSPRTEPRPMP
jgi:hypothetical protein